MGQWSSKRNNNVVVDSFFRCHSLFFLLETKFFNFDHIKDLYPKDDNFSSIHSEFHLGARNEFYLIHDYLFNGKRLCVNSLASVPIHYK